jgi:[acyl-carrier-protein] S-malonyltransferase
MSRTALLFAGQGAQVVGMGKDLAEQAPGAKLWFDRAREVLGFDLASVCFQGPESELTKTENAQPGIFLVSWVAFQLLKERVPAFHFEAAAGLSLGEFTALSAAGVLSFEDGLKLVRQRGRLMQEACDSTRGSMAAIIGLEVAATQAVCADAGVELANLNCPGQLVISGEAEKITVACQLAKSRGAKGALPLTVAGAYHSRLMSDAQTKFGQALSAVSLRASAIPVISNVTARPHGGEAEVRTRLVEQVTSPVRWEESMRYLLAEGFDRFIELGPGKVLTGFMKRIDSRANILAVGNVASLQAAVGALGT